MPAIRDAGYTFNIILTSRGLGKTFGFLKELRADALSGKGRFAYVRRMQTQIDICGKAEFNPFKRLNGLYHYDTSVKAISKYSVGFFEQEQLLGVGVALSTFGSLRGFDGSDITSVVFEECIPKPGEHRLKHEAELLWDMYETINRNRELEGSPPVKLYCIGNNNTVAADLLMDMGLTERVGRMLSKGIPLYQDRKRSLQLIVIGAQGIVEQKKDTALYRFLGAGSAYTEAALDSLPAEDYGRSTGSRPLREYRPIVSVGELTVYRHKSKKELYVSTHRAGDPPAYGTGEMDLSRFRVHYRQQLFDAYINNKIIYESGRLEILLLQYIGA